MATITGTSGNDSLTGTSGNDTLTGFGGNDVLLGAAGNDSLRGNDGTDWLEGGAGSDNLGGGGGQDSFVFREAGSANADVLSDYASNWDNIQLDAAFFTSLGASGRFASGDARFVANSTGTAQDASDRIVLNTATGQLFYDADGTGSGAAQHFATLPSGRTVIASDFWVFGTAPSSGQTINGTSGNDSLVGTEGNDSINGLAGTDTLDGRAGNDTLDGGLGADTMIGGTGDDLFFVDDAGDVTIEQQGGLNGIDTVHASVSHTLSAWVNNLTLIGGSAIDGTGNEIDNVLTGNGAANALSGDGGNDTLWGGTGADRFIFRETGTGNADLVRDWASGSDKLLLDGAVMSALGATGNFAAGDARFKANSTGTATDASDRVTYNTSNGQVWYDADGNGAGARQLIATLQSGATLVATDIAVEGSSGGGRTINGTSGNDNLFGDSGNDTLNGFAGNDDLNGAGGDDLLDGGDGADTLEGQAGNDTAFGGAGDDYFFFESRQDTALGQDALEGGSGLDTLYFFGNFPGGVTVDAAAGTFAGPRPGDGGTLTSIENFMGTSFVDSITGDASANHIYGMGGDDTLAGGSGNDTLQGAFFGIVSNELLIGGDGDDSLIGGGDGNDTLQGGIGDDYLQGGWGSDAIAGDGGNDLIRGNLGNDTLTGGAGADGFLFGANPHPANAVLLTDFASGVDKLRLEASAMPDLGVGGNFATGDVRFYAAAGATGGHDADDRIIYNTSTGALFYDADGNGSGAAQLIATLQGAAALSATDIQVDGGDGPGQVFTGTSGNDSLVGNDGDDTLNGLGGNDTLDGRGGNDSLNGGVGNDSLLGGRGFDHFIGGEGNDTLNGSLGQFSGDREIETDTLDGGSGDDLYIVDNAGDTLLDSGGIDTVRVMDMDWTLGAGFENLVVQNDISESGFTGIGNELDNVIRTTYTGGRLEGLGGNDTLSGGGVGSVRLFGGEGNDSLTGAGDDGGSRLDGGAGNDTMGDLIAPGTFVFSVAPGAANADRIVGFGGGQDIELDGNVHASSGVTGRFAAGDARFAAGAGFTSGQDATDRVVYNTATGQLFYDADGSGSGAAQLIATLEGAPTLSATSIVIINGSTANGGGSGGQTINGTSGNDTLTGTSGNDTINGLGGNDLFLAGSTGGADVIDGGTGSDSIEFKERATSGVVVDFAAGTITGGSSGTISFTGIERTVTGNFNDSLTGNAAGQTLTGQGGADTLWGAGGIDTLWGGAGADRFIFRETGSANADSVRDWASGSDKVALDDAAMSALGASGNFSAGDARFAAGAGFTSGRDASDRVVYNTSTGSLYYDADGSGAGAAQLIATFSGNPAVAATDIVVI